MAQLKTIYECPAYKVIENPVSTHGSAAGLIQLKHNQKLGLLKAHPRHGTLVHTYRVGTVLGYAIDNWEDPDAARERNRRNGGDDHWINACGVTLTAHARAQEVLAEVKVGDRVWIEGKHYEIVAQPNDNLGLVDAGPLYRIEDDEGAVLMTGIRTAAEANGPADVLPRVLAYDPELVAGLPVGGMTPSLIDADRYLVRYC